MRILITGSNGLLGQKLVKLLLAEGIEFLATSKGANRNSSCPDNQFAELDVTNVLQIKNIVESFAPTAIVNTAAMTNVDQCEEDEKNCRLINVKAVEYLHSVTALRNIHLIHISTDFVFDGENGPYSEEDEKNPLSIYARSKSDAEDILINGDYRNWSILRTIILFGDAENMSRSNIVLWSKDALAEGKELTIVDDQFRAPTWADDLANACYVTANRSETGLFHISGPETFSIYELVCRVADYFGHNKDLIKAISSSSLNQAAKRPTRTGFVLVKARNQLNFDPLTFEESLAKLAEED